MRCSLFLLPAGQGGEVTQDMSYHIRATYNAVNRKKDQSLCKAISGRLAPDELPTLLPNTVTTCAAIC